MYDLNADFQGSFQAAINALPNGGTVLVPAGVYQTRTIQWNGKVRFLGSGIDSTIVQSLQSEPLISLPAPGSGISVGTGSFENMTLDGNGIGSAALSVTSLSWFKFRRLRFVNFTLYGVFLSGNLITGSFDDCLFINNPIGIMGQTYNGVGVNLVQFNRCVINQNSNLGAKFVGGSIITFNDCDVELNANGGLWFEGQCAASEGIGAIIRGTWFEKNNGLADVVFKAPGSSRCLHIIESSQMLLGNRQYGVYAEGNTSAVNRISLRSVSIKDAINAGVGTAGSVIVSQDADCLIDGGPAPAPMPSTLAAQFLGATQDKVGNINIQPDGQPDFQIAVQGLKSAVNLSRVRVISDTGGIWESPFNQQNYVVGIFDLSNGSANLYMKQFPSNSFSLSVFYSDGTSDSCQVS